LSGGVFWAAIFFVTKVHYGFSETRNLVLAAAMGAVYAAAARAAGPLARAAPAGATPRAVLVGALAAWTAAALAPALAGGVEPVLWAGALLGAGASAVVWPVVESYLGAGRHGGEMRAAIGFFNVTWTPATAVSLLLLRLVGRGGPLGTLALSAAGSAAALVATAALPSRPARHEPEVARAAVGREYAFLVRCAAWLLPMSYVLCAALAPILPHRLEEVGGTADGAIAALWMIARFVTLLLMWRTGFWHGRWGTLALAAVALAGGLALVLLGSTLASMAVGLCVFGVGMGLSYYAALYYSLSVGHAAVDAGGTFEALIGVGYLSGPVLGLVAHATSSDAHASRATMGLLGLVIAMACAGALRPYLLARKGRS
jgi:hypothetical protein